jgi:D-alanine-D-alanine ligase
MKFRVSIVIGGPSAEHEVSLRTGYEIFSHIDKNRYLLDIIVISHECTFFWCKDAAQTQLSIADLSDPSKSILFKGPYHPAAAEEIWKSCDMALLALHGSYGEDGVFQGYLDSIGIPYQGSDVFASALAMNKIASKFMYIQNGLSVPPFSIYGKDFPEITAESLSQKHGFPCFVKCPQSGSSRLMGRSENLENLKEMLSELSAHSSSILVESMVRGVEFTCGVLEYPSGVVVSLPPVEIRPKSSFFDFTAKYADNASEEICPSPDDSSLRKRIEEVALKAHRVLGCSGVSRTDIIYSDDTLYVLETNTLPGMTSNSLLPKEFKAVGGSYSELLDILISSALAKKKRVLS